MDIVGKIQNTLHAYRTIGLTQLNKVALLKRVDTKFVLTVELLPTLLAELAKDYELLEIDGKSIHQYRSSYYDTDELYCYAEHLRGRNQRFKLRIREYLDSKLAFLEVKKKTNKGETDKYRQPTEVVSANLTQQQQEFVASVLGSTYDFDCKLVNTFKRITLANFMDNERLTIDFDLQYLQADGTEEFSQTNVSIIEIKQSRKNRFTPIFQILKNHNIHPMRVSKYCLGIAQLFDDVKQNRLKPKLRKLNQIAS